MSASEGPAPLLGVDFGTVRVGLAMNAGSVIVPLEVLPYPGSDEALAEALTRIARERSVEGFVLGHPIHMSGELSPMAKRVGRFAEALGELSALPVHLVDERLTSHAAEASMRAVGLRWHEVDKGHIDCLSAMAILKDHLGEELPTSEPDRDSDLLPEPPPAPSTRRDRRAHRRRNRK